MIKSRVLPLFLNLPRLPPRFLALILSVVFPLSAGASPPASSSSTSLNPTVLVGAEPGPVVMVVAGVHGDEVSGPLAARQLAAGPPPARGILVILPGASPEALAAGQRWLPGWSDLNRAFPETVENKTSGPTSIAGSVHAASDPTYQRADEILALIASIQPDLLLDLHESDQYWTEGNGPALVVPASVHSAELALALLESPGMEDFAFTGPPPVGSLVAAVDGLLGVPALLVEVPDALSVDARIAVYHAVVRSALRIMDMGYLETGCLNPGSPGLVGADWLADGLYDADWLIDSCQADDHVPGPDVDLGTDDDSGPGADPESADDQEPALQSGVAP